MMRRTVMTGLTKIGKDKDVSIATEEKMMEAGGSVDIP